MFWSNANFFFNVSLRFFNGVGVVSSSIVFSDVETTLGNKTSTVFDEVTL
jgi:hypothetical protein